jgi:glycosyltransferase involved in cell wall biosynthesis
MTVLSIVIASQDAEATIAECLTSLERQVTDGATEIIVVDNSRDRSARIAESFHNVQLVTVPGRALIPELWGLGAERARGKVVAFTTAHGIPDPNWVAETLRHQASTHAGVGGAITNAEPSSTVQSAIYFCRYTGYMLPFAAHAVDQIPGDNASYKRRVLEDYAGLIKTGFWENVINDHLRRSGQTLWLTPDIRVTHGSAFGGLAFCRQRLVHGRIFGEQRAAAAPPIRLLLNLALSPVIPVVFLGKIARNVFANGRHTRAFLRSLPLLTVFALCWSAGEVIGYLRGMLHRPSGASRTAPTDPVPHR